MFMGIPSRSDGSNMEAPRAIWSHESPMSDSNVSTINSWSTHSRPWAGAIGPWKIQGEPLASATNTDPMGHSWDSRHFLVMAHGSPVDLPLVFHGIIWLVHMTPMDLIHGRSKGNPLDSRRCIALVDASHGWPMGMSCWSCSSILSVSSMSLS